MNANNTPDALPAEACLVMTTLDSETAADALAEQIIDARLAACVQLLPVRSVYVWQGQRLRDAEQLLLIKTPAAQYPALQAFIEAHHPYDTPEIVCLPLTSVSANYLAWMLEQTGPAPDGV